MKAVLQPISGGFFAQPPAGVSRAARNQAEAAEALPSDGLSAREDFTAAPTRLGLIQVATAASQSPAPVALPPLAPILNTVKISPEKMKTPVPTEVLDRAQEYLDRGDRAAAYLTLYNELGNEQILIQTQITTYTGIWGSGALTGNNLAKRDGGERYSTQLDEFSVEIAQATIDAIRDDLKAGGTGRLSDDQFQSADRKVWSNKGMGELFPGNIQFLDFWNHGEGDRGEAIFSRSVWNMVGAATRAMLPDTALFGLNQKGRNFSHLVGKRPAEFEGDPNYTVVGGEKDRFITVYDNRSGAIEAFWDKKPHVSFVPMPQIPNEKIESGSITERRRHYLYEHLGANRHRPAPAGSSRDPNLAG